MRSLSVDSRFHRTLALAGDLVLVNLLMVVTMLPVVTTGAAIAACFMVCFAMLSGDGAQPVRRFLHAFVRLLVPGSLAWLGIAGLAVLLGWEWGVVSQFRSSIAMLAAHTVIGLVAALLAITGVWFWPLLARRLDVAGPVGLADLLPLARTALLAGLRFLPRTLVALLVSVGPVALSAAVPQIGVRMIFWFLVIGPALACYLVALLLRRPLGVALAADDDA